MLNGWLACLAAEAPAGSVVRATPLGETATIATPRLPYRHDSSVPHVGTEGEIIPALMAPDVTVVVPVHNSSAFLGDAVRSALMQEGVQLEVIVVDDGSDDAPAAVLPSDPRVSLLSTSHMGVSQARNRGLEAGRGRMVVFLDADDASSDKFRVRDQLALLDQRPELAIVHSGWEVIDTDGRSVATRTPWTRLHDLSFEHWVAYPIVLPSAMAFRRASVAACGGYDVGLRQMEDVDLVFRLLLRGGAPLGWSG